MKKKNYSIRTLKIIGQKNDSPLEYAKYYDNRFQKSANESLEGKRLSNCKNIF